MAVIEYTLKREIVLGDDKLTVLKFEEPNIQKLEQYDVDLSESALTKVSGIKGVICACVTNATEAHINQMKACDLQSAFAKCESFFV